MSIEWVAVAVAGKFCGIHCLVSELIILFYFHQAASENVWLNFSIFQSPKIPKPRDSLIDSD